MSGKIQIAAVLFMMALATTLGIGAVILFATPLQTQAADLMPVVILASLAVSGPLAWLLAPVFSARLPAYQPATPCTWA
jgi:hypothetical protein